MFRIRRMAFDLADRLQTPIFVMLDLDIGMNEWLCKPLAWDDSKHFDRGKVLTAEELDAGRDFGRYLDVDGDGIAYRTLPGTHPNKGAFFTRGTSHAATRATAKRAPTMSTTCNGCSRSSRRRKTSFPPPWKKSPSADALWGDLLRLDHPFDARGARGSRRRRHPSRHASYPRISVCRRGGGLRFGARTGVRCRAEPGCQLRALLVNECELDPARLIKILHYDGTPITARFIRNAIAKEWHSLAGMADKDAAE